VRDPTRLAGTRVVIVGGGDAALDWALHLAGDGPHRAASVVLVHRRDGFQAAPASVTRMRELCATGAMRFIAGQVTGFDTLDERMTALHVDGVDGVGLQLPADMLLVFFGLSPRLGPIADWGLTIERKQIVVDTEKFETSVPGIFAVGDINTYPGKKKLILSGFHEAALAAFGAAAYVFPDKRIQLQYTTTSPRLHKVLGVQAPAPD
jgi:thioredoxin reductase (NADPH)